MTLEIIVFIMAILFGIIWYWRESKNNKVYRFCNKLTHAKDLQMKPESAKGFIHKQVFLMRLVWITLLLVVVAAVVTFVIPIDMSFIQYFASAVVGTLIGTYIASLFLFARNSTKKENLSKAFQKGKEMVEDFSEDIKEGFEKEEVPEPETPETDGEPKKSARDRFKDKGMIK